MNNIINKIISKEEVNTGRQIEFDIVKTFSVLSMVLIHTWVYLSDNFIVEGSLSFIFVGVLCSLFGASLFMMCMGIGFDYTKNKDNPNFFIKRGIKMFILAYVLNIIRSFVFVFITEPILTGSIQMNTLLYCWFNVDIMQFAGLALIVFGVFKKLKIKPWNMFLIALGIAVLAKFVPMFSTGNGLLDLLLGTIFPDAYLDTGEIYSYFPLMNYLLFPMFGYAYGIFYKRIKNKNLYYAIVVPVTGIIVILFTYLATVNQWSFVTSELEYYHMSFYYSLICTVAGIFIIGLDYYLSLILPKSIFPLFTRLSANINKIYCIHWVILYSLYGILMLYLPTSDKISTSLSLSEGTALAIGIAIYVVSAICARIYSDYKNKKLAIKG